MPKKEKTMKLSKYFEIVHPIYEYYKITSHKSIKNLQSNKIAESIALSYKDLTRRIRKEKEKIFFEANFKVSFMIDIEGGEVSFYIITPTFLSTMILEKISVVWKQATVEKVDSIREFSKDADVYSMTYKREDALSLDANKKNNEPLASILGVCNIINAADRVSVLYNFQPVSQFGWRAQYNETMNKIHRGELIDKNRQSTEYRVKSVAVLIQKLFDNILKTLGEVLGNNTEDEKDSLINAVLGIMGTQDKLSESTTKKAKATICDTQIAVISESEDYARKAANALAVCQSYTVLGEKMGNELDYFQIKNKDIKATDYDIAGAARNRFSTEEMAACCLQLPGRGLLQQHKIQHINIEETVVPKLLSEGYIDCGVSTYKGVKTLVHFQDHQEIGALGVAMLGAQGAGKSTGLEHYAKCVASRNESVFDIDFIKNNGKSKRMAKVLNPENTIILDLSTEEGLQSFYFCESEVAENMSLWEKLKVANTKTNLTCELVDAININAEPLSASMTRYLSAACQIVYLFPRKTLKDAMRVLTNHEYRHTVLSNLDIKAKSYLEDEVLSLEELNDIDKNGEIVGTKDSKIVRIVDRVNLLKKDLYLKTMYNAPAEKSTDFVKALDEGKHILIRMPQDQFKKCAVNVITTFFVLKLWNACEIRGKLHEVPRRVHLIIDEFYQAKTAERYLAPKLVESRKFQVRPVFALHYLDELDEQTIKYIFGNGFSYMLMRGSIKKDFEYLKAEFNSPFEHEDLTDMCKTYKYPSMNLIKYQEGFFSVITETYRKLKKDE